MHIEAISLTQMNVRMLSSRGLVPQVFRNISGCSNFIISF